ncbi:MAG: SGNH/GDSL hydrolase family protein [Ginsengibacter sp.]
MSKKNVKCLILIITSFFWSNSYSQKPIKLIDAQDPHIQFEGRIGMNNPGIAEIYWPGSSCKIRFNGTGVKATLKDQGGNNYYNVIIDDDSIYVLKLDSNKTTFTLASNLSEGEHTVELFRRTDWNDGVTWFYGFQIPSNAKILNPLKTKNRMIEFYGNSITVGAGIHYKNNPNATSENNYLSYAAITARHFNAKYSCIARSGIGLMVSWFPMIMPEMYYRLNPFDSSSKWDFSKAIPNIVVINIFQNDNSLVDLPDDPQFRRRFGKNRPTEDFIIKSYSNFVQQIRSHYPKAYIICVLGNMDAVKPGSPWLGYIKKAVDSLHDRKIYTHFFRYKNTPDHPSVEEQLEMAESLIRFIDVHCKW